MIKEYLVKDPQGLHARPASLIVQEAAKHTEDVYIYYNEKKANAKSVMGVMSLAITVNTSFRIEVIGDEVDQVFQQIENILTTHHIV